MEARPIPPAATRDTGAIELARVWIAERGLHCSLKVGMYSADGLTQETTAWGIILADLAGHIADALSADGLGSKAGLLDAIIESFNDEVSSPTSPRSSEVGPKVA